MQLDPCQGEGVTTAATGADTQTMKTNLTWIYNAERDEYQSTDWHWEIAPGTTPGLYDVRDLIEREWFAHDVPLEQAKQACENVHAEQLAELGIDA